MRQLLARRRGRGAGVLQHRLCLSAEAGALSQPGRSAQRTAEKIAASTGAECRGKHFAAAVIPCCFAKARAIPGGELLSLKAATRYDLGATSIGGNYHERHTRGMDAAPPER